mgnify:CR=1 FL=1
MKIKQIVFIVFILNVIVVLPVKALDTYICIEPTYGIPIKEDSLKTKEDEINSTTDKRVFTVVEQMPQFPGGNSEMSKFIYSNLKYPKEHQETAIQGRVFLRFIVEKDGSISNIKIERSIDSILDAEAIRVVESMPKWKPGKQNGEPVRVYYLLPIAFRLQ